MKPLRHQTIHEADGIEGWMNLEDLGFLFDHAAVMDSVVEVGCWKGRSTYVLAKACKGTVTAVDTFRGTPGDAEHMRRVAAAGGSTLAQFSINVQSCPNVRVLQMDSVEAASMLSPVDMVFIDGAHTYAEVKADLEAWLPKTRKLICGHDFECPDVQRAVKEVLGEVYSSGNHWFKTIGAKRAPLFSILHTSARPDKWRAVYDDWMSRAVRRKDVEYVLVIDPRWGFSQNPEDYATPLDNVRVVVNNRRRCYVDGVNLAAQESTGKILIVNADDQFACEKWDQELRIAVDYQRAGCGPKTPECVIEVSTGTPDEHERGIMVMPILSRARYQQQGFVFYPEYESMFADNDFCESARKDNVVIDARHLLFPHRHAMFDGKGGWKTENWKETLDAAYLAQNSQQAGTIGHEVYTRRKAAGFTSVKPQQGQRSIALCLSGEHFQGVWVDYLLSLYAHLISLGFSIYKFRSYTSNVCVTREELRRAVLECEPKPDMFLWWDDDNPVSIAAFDKLLADFDAHPEVDGIAGWCWIHNERKAGFMVSCGEWAPDHLHWNPFDPSFANETQLRPFETGGLPVILMRRSAMEKAGDGAFLPIVDSRLQYGIAGEDMSFFLRAEKGGAKFLVDPEVRVPHLKYVEVEPVLPEQGKVAVKVACMIRAKNEARWIARTIESVRELCGENIFVMEDGSTDDTYAVAEKAGAVMLPSPFVGQGFNEVRDKDWLLAEVKRRCNPDWILMPDGDEELQAGGCEKIRKALESNPPVDCFTLRFLYLWNSVKFIRIDGVYGSMERQSIFRAKNNLVFKSMYEGEGAENHCGLHCSNAPGLGGLRIKPLPLPVFLLHYGYLHREDRIRKFAWIAKLDPRNEQEGFYLHSVQGDIPEVPSSAKLKHAGPLQLVEMPARLVPDFVHDVPGPLAVDQNILFEARLYASEVLDRSEVVAG